jgi:general secretion pathway protein K
MARMCTDANEAQKFIMAMTMLRSFMPGLPVFKNPQEFVSALQQTNAAPAAAGAAAPGGLGGGGSPIAAIMKALQIDPIPIVSAAETAKMVTTESKVFSIYATGYVRSGKRETSVRIHAVVDFRGAPTPQDLISQLLNATGNAQPGSTAQTPPASSAQNPANLPPGVTAGGILNALKPGSGGNIVYYRVD